MLVHLRRRFREFPRWARWTVLGLWLLPCTCVCGIGLFVDPPPPERTRSQHILDAAAPLDAGSRAAATRSPASGPALPPDAPPPSVEVTPSASTPARDRARELVAAQSALEEARGLLRDGQYEQAFARAETALALPLFAPPDPDRDTSRLRSRLGSIRASASGLRDALSTLRRIDTHAQEELPTEITSYYSRPPLSRKTVAGQRPLSDLIAFDTALRNDLAAIAGMRGSRFNALRDERDRVRRLVATRRITIRPLLAQAQSALSEDQVRQRARVDFVLRRRAEWNRWGTPYESIGLGDPETTDPADSARSDDTVLYIRGSIWCETRRRFGGFVATEGLAAMGFRFVICRQAAPDRERLEAPL